MLDAVAVLYTSTMHPQPAGYAFADMAVQRVLDACSRQGATSEDAMVAFVCRYAQSFHTHHASDAGDAGGAGSNVVQLNDLAPGISFDPDAVEECRRVYERIVGSGDGFLAMAEDMRPLQREAVEDEL